MLSSLRHEPLGQHKMHPDAPDNRSVFAKYLVPFGGSAIPPEKTDRQILGGKGLGLQEMSRIGVDVPPGFTLTTQVCQLYETSDQLPDEMWQQVKEAVAKIETDMHKQFGSYDSPLLFSCRSGAAISMPGMMDTVLDIGLNSDTVKGLAAASNNKRFAYDAYRRLLDMFGDVVLGIPHEAFEKRLALLKKRTGKREDTEFTADDLERLCEDYKLVYEEYNEVFPEDPYDQLRACIKAVFGSWKSARAIKYREINGITGLLGTACNIQCMVYGNLGSTSGTGVAFSRDPGTGEAELKGEYLINAQGEDVVAGIRTPEPISRMAQDLPEAYLQFVRNISLLERHFKDMQDVEFTVEDGKLWMLQCRSGKRTGQAAFRIAVDMVEEGICTPQEALLRIEADHVRQILHPTFSKESLGSATYRDNVVAVGLSGGPGAAVGKVVFAPQTAEERSAEGVILVRENTSPEDVGGMWAAHGILTSRGGVTSHAAVVARGWGKPCVCGCDDLEINEQTKTMTVKSTGECFKEGDTISINGSTGEVIRIAIETSEPSFAGTFSTVLDWADRVGDKCKVMANADSGPDALKAAELGAKGIGLCRTEHMFFAPERLPVVRRWILRGEGLDQVRGFQRKDFAEIFKAMNGKPVTIRLLDPPLHEFLPRVQQVDPAMATELGYEGDVTGLINDIESMHEENPMLGLRGCRLAIVRPEVTAMQAGAIINAAADVMEADPKSGRPFPRIMVPLVGCVAEFTSQALSIKQSAEKIKTERKIAVPYELGTMIEVPRAALVSEKIAAAVDPADGKLLCDFFSFGTNDLTQMTLGISRDDAGAFIPSYQAKGIFEEDPFKTIDEEGVGWLVRRSSVEGRKSNPQLSLSVCGEHGGDPSSISFFDKVGLDYVSCSPFRVPVARLATGQAAIRRGGSPCDVHRRYSGEIVTTLSPELL